MPNLGQPALCIGLKHSSNITRHFVWRQKYRNKHSDSGLAVVCKRKVMCSLWRSINQSIKKILRWRLSNKLLQQGPHRDTVNLWVGGPRYESWNRRSVVTMTPRATLALNSLQIVKTGASLLYWLQRREMRALPSNSCRWQQTPLRTQSLDLLFFGFWRFSSTSRRMADTTEQRKRQIITQPHEFRLQNVKNSKIYEFVELTRKPSYRWQTRAIIPQTSCMQFSSKQRD